MTSDCESQSPIDAHRVETCIVHKFGGSSVADAHCMHRVADILAARPATKRYVVVSAMRGVTDTLIALTGDAIKGNLRWRDASNALYQRHLGIACDLLDGNTSAIREWLNEHFRELDQLLDALAGGASPARDVLERIQGLGEVWLSRILAEYLRAQGGDYAWLDARDVLVVSHNELGAVVDWETSAQRMAEWRNTHRQAHAVVTGFIARTVNGRETVLGRNGSDYSAAIFAALINATELVIWGDTDGILSADPRMVPDAVPLANLSYDEACELAYFGARVIHPQTLTPAIAHGLPIRVKNTFKPDHAGTLITANSADGLAVKGLSTATGLALLNLEGARMIGVPGTAERVFGALRTACVSVVMISQGSSEHSICCVVREGDAAKAQAALQRAFASELAAGEVKSVYIDLDISVLAAVGNGMTGTLGIAARLFSALGRARVNVRAIAQGSSERNISIAVASADAPRALRAAHSAFWLSPQTLSIGLIGPGRVGSALLAQLEDTHLRLRKTGLDLRVRAIAGSRRMWLGEAVAAEQCMDMPTDLETLTAHVRAEHLPHALIVDCSASGTVADHYAGWLADGIHVITPNKQAGSGLLTRWQAIRAAAASGARFRYEATVGAGLPVIQTLRDLLDTGDKLISIEGVFSGSLAWMFNSYDGSRPFSEWVREAHELGYTEPDPREDLAGVDVARKLVILAREAGRELDLEQINIESLLPLASQRDSISPLFYDRLKDLDIDIAARYAHAKSVDKVLRYVAHLDETRQPSVGLVEVSREHAFAHLLRTDNIVQFTTHRYRENPLIVQGPGAGTEVTAAGVFADILRIAAELGAHL